MKWMNEKIGLLNFFGTLIVTAALIGIAASGCADTQRIKMAAFEADASPPIGSPLAYGPTERIGKPLTARGVVIVGNEQPIVLMAVDWIGIYNEPNDIWRERLAEAAGTTPERVTIHMLHQHDAPWADFTTGEILDQYDIHDTGYDNREFVEETIERTAKAVRNAVDNDLQEISHVGTGEGIVKHVASNRRLLNRQGKVRLVRYTSGADDPEAREAPVGTIDPKVRLLSFWNGDEPVAALSYYATHPQSYYRTGVANPDFPGLAREARDEATGVMHIHFTGAGGNVGAGKWNDGAPEMRPVLAERLAAGMADAWEQTERTPVHAGQLEWRTESVALPPRENLDEEELSRKLEEKSADDLARAARELAFLDRYKAGHKIRLAALRVGPARLLHTPGELAVEYQLEAQSIYPDDFIANASYTYMAAGYISTEIQYTQGGYEDSERASRVAPEVAHVLRPAIRKVLAFDAFQPDPEIIALQGYRLERSAVQRGFDGELSWVQGRAGLLPAGTAPNPISKPTVILTSHELEHTESDVFKGLHLFRSRDLGMTWEGPFEEPAFRRESVTVGGEEELDRLVSGFTPRYHSASRTLLGIGQTVHYEGKHIEPVENRRIVYATFDVDAQQWSDWRFLELPGGTGLENAGAGSVQRIDLDDGTILLPVYFNEPGSGRYRVTVIRCRFDGNTLEYIEHGNVLSTDLGNGFYEPSLTRYNGNFYLALRNDEEAYLSRSEDGLHFEDPMRWSYDDGSPFGGGNAPLKWVPHSDGLYLAFAHPEGALFLAMVDPEQGQVIEQTESVIIPAGDDDWLDNIDVTDVTEDETWVIATEWKQPDPEREYATDNMIHVAKLKWTETNTLFGN